MSKVKFGLSNVVIAPFTVKDGAYEYETPIKVPGGVNLSLEPSGESNDFFADNIKYFSASENQGYEGDLEIAMLPDALQKILFGNAVDKNEAYIESATDKISPFALGFQVEGDELGRKFWYYNCIAERPKNESKTTENSKEPTTDTLTIKALPRETDKRVRVFMAETEENKEAYATFLDAVYEEIQVV